MRYGDRSIQDLAFTGGLLAPVLMPWNGQTVAEGVTTTQ